MLLNTLPLILFVFTATVTPGPNNIMLAASGVNFGIQRTLPHMGGILAGFFTVSMLVGVGLTTIFQNLPILHEIIRWCGVVYILFIAYKIATTKTSEKKEESKGEPLTFWQAYVFQYLNVKGWAMGSSAYALFSNLEWHFVWNALFIAIVFQIITVPCLFLWTAFGVFLRRMLRAEKALRIFNYCMAGLLLLSISILFV